MLNELLTLNVFGFFLIFARVGTVIMLLPGFSGSYVSIPIRLALALAICLALAPFLMPLMPKVPATPAQLVLMMASEVLIGGLLGTMSRIAMAAIQTAGFFIAMFSSLANALIQDAISEEQSSVISSFMGSVAIILIFVTNLHHLMLEAIVDTYSIFTPGVIESIGDFAMLLARGVAQSFALGLQLASPFLIIALVYNVGLGLLGRLMPALPLFFFMMPIQITVQIMALMVTLSAIMLLFLRHFQETLMMFANP